MNLTKREILIATAAFIYSILFSNFMGFNWILPFGIASGFLLRILLMHLWKKEAGRQGSPVIE